MYNTKSACADLENTGVVVANSRSQGRGPVVYVNMFCFRGSTADRMRHKHVVQLLAIVIKYVRIPFCVRDSRYLVYIGEQRGQGRKHRSRLEEFIAVTGDNDIRVGVFFQYGCNERLMRVPSAKSVALCAHVLPQFPLGWCVEQRVD
jgi:hypothetical protein